jgi:CheY-like chemotaxis protein
MHGGTVCADSSGIGQGATFTVRLPLLKSEGEKIKDEERFNSSLILRPSSLPLAGLQILLVEDEVDNREMLALSLKQHGAKVVAVSSAAEAKSAIALFEPNIIISDIAMSEEDGYTLMRQMRSQGKQMPAIALTAYARESDCAEAIASGFQRHISKPIDPEELITVVADLVGRG